MKAYTTVGDFGIYLCIRVFMPILLPLKPNTRLEVLQKWCAEESFQRKVLRDWRAFVGHCLFLTSLIFAVLGGVITAELAQRLLWQSLNKDHWLTVAFMGRFLPAGILFISSALLLRKFYHRELHELVKVVGAVKSNDG